MNYPLNLVNTNEIKSLLFHLGLKGVMPAVSHLMGAYDELATGVTATESVERMIANNHVMLNVNSITGSGVVVITGDSISESSGVVNVGDTENITVDATGKYQTDNKWMRITDITIPGEISAINYDVWTLGYFDNSNKDFRLTGYRFEINPTNSTTIDFQLQICKAQDDGDKKCSIIVIEDITISGTTPWIVDTKRSARDYSTATATILKIGEPAILKQTDFESYFSSDENVMESENKHEGIFAIITWDNVDFAIGNFYYKSGLAG